MLVRVGFPAQGHAQFTGSRSEPLTVLPAPLSCASVFCVCRLLLWERSQEITFSRKFSGLLYSRPHLKFKLLSPFFREIKFSYVSYIFSKVSITRVAALDALGPRPCAVHSSLLLHRRPLRKSRCQSFRLEYNLVTA